MTIIREKFGHDRVVLPVIHLTSPRQAAEEARLVFGEGADGVFLIHHGCNHRMTVEASVDVRDEEIGRLFERCDARDRLAPTCQRCGGEKFSIPGQFANIGWICGHCNKPKTVVAPSVETHGKADVLISFNDGIARTVTVYSVREGWHACPPCGTLTPVYATPRDAALAHARGLTEAIPTDAKEVQHVRGE